MVFIIPEKDKIPCDKNVEIAQCKDCHSNAIYSGREYNRSRYTQIIKCPICGKFIEFEFSQSVFDDDDNIRWQKNKNLTIMAWNYYNTGDFLINSDN